MLIRNQFDKPDDENFGKITLSDVVENHDRHIFREEWLSTIYMHSQSQRKQFLKRISVMQVDLALSGSEVFLRIRSSKNHPYSLIYYFISNRAGRFKPSFQR